MNQSLTDQAIVLVLLPGRIRSKRYRHKYIPWHRLYSYLFARYSGISYVWYVGNLSGNVQITLLLAVDPSRVDAL